jgi:hypothetical protein
MGLFAFLTKPLAWALAGALLVLGLLAGGWWLHHTGYESGRADNEAAHTLADLQAFKAETGRLAGLSTQLATQIDSLASAAPTVIKEYHETVVKAPLPAGCLIDSGRLRSIQDAIAQATAAGQRGAAVPAGAGVR